MSFTRMRMGKSLEPMRNDLEAGAIAPDPSRICAYHNYTPLFKRTLTIEYDYRLGVAFNG